MEPADLRRAVPAAMSTVSAVGLRVDDAVVLRDSDKVMLRVLPCDVVVRIEHAARGTAQFELEIAQALATAGAPAAALDARVEPRVYRSDGFAMTLWTHYENDPSRPITAAEYARALERLHAAMRGVAATVPHLTERVAGAESIVADPDVSPALADEDREFLATVLPDLTRKVRTSSEQVIHGEPHPGNILRTNDGPIFIDLETCIRGPIEFDIAHAESFTGAEIDLRALDVAEHYVGADSELVRSCVLLTLALITTWRWHRDDQLPDGRGLGVEWLRELRSRLDEGSGE
jgi:hypothetical protein